MTTGAVTLPDRVRALLGQRTKERDLPRLSHSLQEHLNADKPPATCWAGCDQRAQEVAATHPPSSEANAFFHLTSWMLGRREEGVLSPQEALFRPSPSLCECLWFFCRAPNSVPVFWFWPSHPDLSSQALLHLPSPQAAASRRRLWCLVHPWVVGLGTQ